MGFIYSSLYTSGTCAARLAKRPEVVFFYLHLCTKWTPGDESARCGQECVVIKQVKGSSRSRYPEKKPFAFGHFDQYRKVTSIGQRRRWRNVVVGRPSGPQ